MTDVERPTIRDNHGDEWSEVKYVDTKDLRIRVVDQYGDVIRVTEQVMDELDRMRDRADDLLDYHPWVVLTLAALGGISLGLVISLIIHVAS